jgi:hypothetical protein
MVSPELLSKIERRIREVKNVDVPWGGLVVLALGDFKQIPPVGGMTLLKACLLRPAQIKGTDGIAGANLWKQARLVELKEQMRSRECDIQTERANALHSGDAKKALGRGLKVLTQHEARDSFRSATHIVATNAERRCINRILAIEFGKEHNQPVIWWNHEICGADVVGQAASTIAACFDTFPELSTYFVCGAPAVTLTNICPQLGLANGSPVLLHSLVPSKLEDELAIQAAAPGQLVEISPPLHVNVLLKHSTGDRAAPTLVPNFFVYPIAPFSDSVKVTLPDGAKKAFSQLASGVDLAFAVTFHKSQGATLSKVILHLEKPPKGCGKGLSFEMLLVGMTRVRKDADMRVMPTAFGTLPDLKHLEKLKPDTFVHRWFAGKFGGDGVREYPQQD